MPIFTRIFDFKRAVLASLRDKRLHPRHRVGVGFPLKASLSLVGSGNFSPGRASVRGSGVNWSGNVGDISTNGLSILLSPAATTARGESTVLRLTLENHAIEVPCTIAHFRVYNSYAVCGVQLEFADFKPQKDFLQLVEAVKMGSSFVPTGPGRSSTGFVSRSWRAANKARLTEWRETDSRALDRFELTLGDHTVQGRKSRPGLEVNDRKGGAKSVPPAVEEEVRQLFRWVVGNLPKTVPTDLREFLARAGGNPAATSAPAVWQAPAAPLVSTPAAATPPPAAWQAPKPKVTADTGA